MATHPRRRDHRQRQRPTGQRPVPALRFRLFGFPVQADASFLLISAMLGFGLPGRHLVLWVGIAALAVLGHELGHALAARSLGAEARIELAGLGGLTHWQTQRALSKGQQAFVTAAGPGAGFLLGLPVLVASQTLGWEGWTDGGFALRAGAWATLGWSVLNLVPILPLDGGTLLELALPGDHATRRRTAAMVGTAVGGTAAILAYKAGMHFTGLFAAMLAFQNFATVKRLAVSDEDSPDENDGRPARRAAATTRSPVLDRLREAIDCLSRGDHEQALALTEPLAGDTLLPDDWRVTARLVSGLSLVALGRADEAVAAAATTRACPESVRGYAQAAGGDTAGGLTVARSAYAHAASSNASSREAAGWLAETMMLAGSFDDAADFVEAEGASALPSLTAWRLTAVAFALGAYAASGRIGDAVAASSAGPEAAVAAYNAGCGWSRAGDGTRALASLGRALSLGWEDLEQVDADPDLAAAPRPS